MQNLLFDYISQYISLTEDWLLAIPNDHFVRLKQSFKTDDIIEMAKTTNIIFL